FTTQTYSVQLPDLTGTIASNLDGKTITAGTKAKATVSLQNTGNVPAKGPVGLTLLASPDGTMTNAVELARMAPKKLTLKPNAAKKVNVSFAVPKSLPSGNWHLV